MITICSISVRLKEVVVIGVVDDKEPPWARRIGWRCRPMLDSKGFSLCVAEKICF
jgi:hypothetical protein